MPAKNRVKDYHKGATYHIYNRGIDSKEIFRTDEDYQMWIELMKRYLGEWSIKTDDRFKAERPYILRHKQDMNLYGQVKLFAYCLLPDHFHILVHQETEIGITQMMRRMVTNYVMYFNRKYKRRGVLFENVYRAVLLPDEETTVWISKFIHLNPTLKTVKRFGLVETSSVPAPEYYMYSSYQNFLKTRTDDW
ncbi:MAG: transposase, partial [Patescibacteria group bacterium]